MGEPFLTVLKKWLEPFAAAVRDQPEVEWEPIRGRSDLFEAHARQYDALLESLLIPNYLLKPGPT